MEEKVIEICKNFSLSTEVGVALLDENGQMLFKSVSFDKGCSFCLKMKRCFGLDGLCEKTFLYGSVQAQRFGGRYIFFCHLGLVHFISPIVRDERLKGAIVSQPFIMIDKQDYFENDILDRYGSANSVELYDLLSDVPYISPERVHALSETLFIHTAYLSRENAASLEQAHENQKLQTIISDYITKLKKSADGEGTEYPFKKEDELLDAIARGDKQEAKALLNEIMGKIFFYSGYSFLVIRSRVIELIALLSRAAVKGGADMELVLGLNYNYLNEVDNFSNIEDLAYWLSIIMNRFMDYVFDYANVKHVDTIHKAVAYIKNNYMDKLTLEDAAKYVYLSPSYFSKVFKDETGYNFNTYVNKVRVDHSKKLLLSQEVDLADISNLVGYGDQSYFTKVFKKMTGMSPGRFRRSDGGKNQ